MKMFTLLRYVKVAFEEHSLFHKYPRLAIIGLFPLLSSDSSSLVSALLERSSLSEEEILGFVFSFTSERVSGEA